MVRTILIFVVSVVMGPPPASASAVGRPTPLGVVLVADKAQARPDLIYSGATIYDGDRLQTPRGETLVVRLGSGQIVLRENSAAIVRSAPRGFAVELESGSLAVSSAQGQTFQVLADGATIRSLNEQPTSAQIVKISSVELTLMSSRGALEVRVDEEVKTIEAGTASRIEIQAEESGAAAQPSATRPAPGGRLKQVAIRMIGGVVIVLVTIRALESGDRL